MLAALPIPSSTTNLSIRIPADTAGTISPATVGQKLPQLGDTDALHGQHAVLQAVQILAVDRRHELSGDQA